MNLGPPHVLKVPSVQYSPVFPGHYMFPRTNMCSNISRTPFCFQSTLYSYNLSYSLRASCSHNVLQHWSPLYFQNIHSQGMLCFQNSVYYLKHLIFQDFPMTSEHPMFPKDYIFSMCPILPNYIPNRPYTPKVPSVPAISLGP